jgi:hypothetical protein
MTMVRIEMTREEADLYQTALDELCSMTTDFASEMRPEDEALSGLLADIAGTLRQLQFKISRALG